MNNEQSLSQIKKMLAAIHEFESTGQKSITFPLPAAKFLAELAYEGCFRKQEAEELPENVIDFKKWREENKI